MILSSDSGLNVLRRTTGNKWHSRYAWNAGFPRSTRPWWTWRNQRRPGRHRKDWAPGTSWCRRKERRWGRFRSPRPHRSNRATRGERRDWNPRVAAAFFTHELERMHLEKGWRQRLRCNPGKWFTVPDCNIFNKVLSVDYLFSTENTVIRWDNILSVNSAVYFDLVRLFSLPHAALPWEGKDGTLQGIAFHCAYWIIFLTHLFPSKLEK